ncbi:FABP family protein [Actinomyces minihominis]|uniref:FABP family protein n=1 Tax=Actinomyces minihominis TaxID=2002838 RepID=UPI000C07F88C|nr:heme-binding beta-barrel domain-containing protein [Actinomyces minihominis]
MFEIPSDLPLKLSSLAWLLGRWQGWGTVAVPAESTSDSPTTGEEADFNFEAILQDIEAVIVGEQMRMSIRTYMGVLEGDFDPMWTAAQGLDQIRPGELLGEETTYWSVDTPLAVVPAGEDEPRELRVVGSDTRGFSVLWAGVAMGPRIQLASDALVRAPRTIEIDHFSRMYGLVGGELMWANESMPTNGEFVTEMTGRLQRTASANDVADE